MGQKPQEAGKKEIGLHEGFQASAWVKPSSLVGEKGDAERKIGENEQMRKGADR